MEANNFLNIDENSGQLSIKDISQFDYEVITIKTLTASVSDKGRVGKQFSFIVTHANICATIIYTCVGNLFPSTQSHFSRKQFTNRQYSNRGSKMKIKEFWKLSIIFETEFYYII